MRNQDITYTKAVGIMLMVLCHAMAYDVPFVYMFHMPLFFFFSGYCLKTEYFDKPQVFAWKRVKGIWWPYVKWSVVFLLLHNVFFRWNFYMEGKFAHIYSTGEILDRLSSIFLLMDKHEGMLGGYWFMRALFRGSLIAFVLLWVLNAVSRTAKKRYAYNLLVGGGILLTFCMILNHFERTLTVLYFSPQDFLAAVFFLLGHACRHYNVRKFYTGELIVVVALVIVGSLYWKMATNVIVYENTRMLPYIVTAVLGTWAVYTLPWHYLRGRVATLLQFIGNNTLTVLTWHFLAFKLVSLLIIYMYGLPMVHLGDFPVIANYSMQGWWVIYFLTAMLNTCAFAYCNRWIKSSWFKL